MVDRLPLRRCRQLGNRITAGKSTPTWSVVLAHLAMTDEQAWQSIDNVMWSLVIELRLSLIFPIIAVAVEQDWRVWPYAADAFFCWALSPK